MEVEDGSVLTHEAWELLVAEGKGLGLNLKVETPPEFAARARATTPTTWAQRKEIIEQALLLAKNLYPHAPFKKEGLSHFFDSFHGLGNLLRAGLSLKDDNFHRQMLLAFSRMRDAHTLYSMPPPWQDAILFLPFQVRGWRDSDGQLHCHVTRVMDAKPDRGLGHEFFRSGARIVRWNGQEMEDMLHRVVFNEPAGNDAAKLAWGFLRCTIRPLIHSTFVRGGESNSPVTLEYIAEGETEVRGIRIPWGVLSGIGANGGFPPGTFSVSPMLSIAKQVEQLTYSRWEMFNEQRIKSQAAVSEGAPDSKSRVESILPELFEFQYTSGFIQRGSDPGLLRDKNHPEKKFGYIRIKGFTADLDPLSATVKTLAEFRRILELMNEVAPDGLILDIRGNPGGNVEAAERMLQMITPHRIEPLRFHFANTDVVRRILQQVSDANLNRTFSIREGNARGEFERWLPDLVHPRPESEHLTSGQTLTDSERANDIGQIHQGPVVLLIDAMTYSAGDMFAAGFDDHQAGTIIGVDERTGGGGADKWEFEEVIARVPELPEIPLQPLPGGVGMSIAIRRCTRVGRHEGRAIEDLGVDAHVVHTRTLADLFDSRDLLAFACETLGKASVHRVVIKEASIRDEVVNVTVETLNVQKLNFADEDDVPLGSAVVTSSPQTFPVTLGRRHAESFTLKVNGLMSDVPVAAARVPLNAGQTDTAVAASAVSGADDDLLNIPPTS
jgi:hypothetical protein